MKPGDRVEVEWARLGWLPGTLIGFTAGEVDEDFQRVQVKMDNGFACHGSGFHPDCVRKVQS